MVSFAGGPSASSQKPHCCKDTTDQGPAPTASTGGSSREHTTSVVDMFVADVSSDDDDTRKMSPSAGSWEPQEASGNRSLTSGPVPVPSYHRTYSNADDDVAHRRAAEEALRALTDAATRLHNPNDDEAVLDKNTSSSSGSSPSPTGGTSSISLRLVANVHEEEDDTTRLVDPTLVSIPSLPAAPTAPPSPPRRAATSTTGTSLLLGAPPPDPSDAHPLLHYLQSPMNDNLVAPPSPPPPPAVNDVPRAHQDTLPYEPNNIFRSSVQQKAPEDNHHRDDDDARNYWQRRKKLQTLLVALTNHRALAMLLPLEILRIERIASRQQTAAAAEMDASSRRREQQHQQHHFDSVVAVQSPVVDFAEDMRMDYEALLNAERDVFESWYDVFISTR
jgi:hypothetical protein